MSLYRGIEIPLLLPTTREQVIRLRTEERWRRQSKRFS
jgi:hypothetical protein